MSIGLWLVFDVAVVLLAGYVIFSNGRRGYAKVLILCIGYIVTTLLASVISAVAAPYLYETVAENTNVSGIQTANQHTDFVKIFYNAMKHKQYGFEVNYDKVCKYVTGEDNIEFDSNLYHYANRMSGSPVSTKAEFQQEMQKAFIAEYGKALGERLPQYVRMNFEEMTRLDPQLMRITVSDFYNNKISSAQKAASTEQIYAKEPTTEVLQIFIYFILFSIFMVIAAIFSAIGQKRIFFNIRVGTDHFLGGLLGILEAGAMIVLLTLLVRLIVMLTGGSGSLFNHTVIGESKIFSFFYDNISRLL